MKKIEEIITSHRYYMEHYEEEEKEMFLLKNAGFFGAGNYRIKVPHAFNLSKNFNQLIGYSTDGREVYIQEYPLWFKKLYKEVYDLYYEKNRLRILTEFGKKPYADIVLLHSLFVRDGATFFRQMLVEDNGFIMTHKKWEREIEKITPLLTKEGYNIVFCYEANENNNIYQLK